MVSVRNINFPLHKYCALSGKNLLFLLLVCLVHTFVQIIPERVNMQTGISLGYIWRKTAAEILEHSITATRGVLLDPQYYHKNTSVTLNSGNFTILCQ